MLWLWILDNTLGISNALIEGLTGESVNFFSSALAIPTIAFINVRRHMGLHGPAHLRRAPPISTRSTRRARSTAPASGRCSGGSPCRCCDRSWRWFHHDDDRVLPGLWTPTSVTPRAAPSTPPGSCSTTSTTWPSAGSSSATPPPSPSGCSSSWRPSPPLQYRLMRAGQTDLD